MPQNPSDEPDSPQMDEVLAEFIRRRDAGEPVDVESLCAARPDLADALRSYADGEALLREMALDDSVPAGSAVAETIRPGAMRETDSLIAGRTLGNYRLIRQLGQGAMGAVYLAEDTTLQRQAAVKVPKFSPADGRDARERFFREARAAAALNHPQICPVFHADEVHGTPFIAMAFINGQPLSRFVGTADFQDQRRVAQVLRLVADGLQHAHERGIIHRDLKPGNIMLDQQGQPVVTDFGLARRLVQEQESRITQEGQILGTPAYMSPEQITGNLDNLTSATDIYALGVVLFELLTGRLPFQGNAPAVIAAALHTQPPKPSSLRADVDPELEALCLQMLRKEAAQRPKSMREVSDRLAKWLEKPAPPSAAEQAAARQLQTELEAEQQKIKQSIRSGQFQAALKQLQGLARRNEPAAAEFRKWAAEQIPRVKALPARVKRDEPEMVRMAQDWLKRHDYEQAIQILRSIPDLCRSDETEELLQQAVELQEEADDLLLHLKNCVQKRQYDGIEADAKRLLELKPGNQFAKNLWQKLHSYRSVPAASRRYRFDSKGRLLPMNDGGDWTRNLILAGLTGLLVFGLMTWGIVIYLRNDDQTLAVEVDDEWLKQQNGRLSLSVDGKDRTITGPGFDIKVALGDRGFSVKNGDAIVHNPQTFTIEKEGRQVLRIDRDGVTLVTNPRARGASSQRAGTGSAGGWINLFNGKDLTGWIPFEDQQGTTKNIWQVQDGAITVPKTKSAFGILLSERDYGDFQLQLEFHPTVTDKAIDSGDGGILFLAAADLKFPASALEVGIRNGVPDVVNTGDLAYLSRASKPVGKGNDWNTMQITLEKRRLTVIVNGERVQDLSLDDLKTSMSHLQQVIPRRKGRIALTNHGGVVAYRNIRIRELAPADGWIDLFNGKDLNGWDGDPEIWKVGNGVLSVKRAADAARFPAYLVWQGGEPADFDLKFDVKLVHGHTDIIFRGRKLDNPQIPVGGYRCYLYHKVVFPGLSNSLSQVGEYPELWLAGRGERTILLKDQAPQVQWIADSGRLFREHVKPGDWNSVEISTRGEVISVKVNDQDMATIIDRIDMRAERRGLIAIAASFPEDIDLELRNLRLRDSGRLDGANAAPPAAIAPFTADQARAHQDAWARHLKVPTKTKNSLGMSFELIPPGQFTMGAEKDVVGDQEQHRPQHKVVLTTPFWMSAFEVTQDEFLSVTGRTPSAFRPDGMHGDRVKNSDTEKLPVDSVSWFDAVEFCNLLSQKESLQPAYSLTDIQRNGQGTITHAVVAHNIQAVGYRLPTEAEWEFACRAGTTTAFYYGNSWQEHALFSRVTDNVENKHPVPVGSLRPNAWGLYDMHGNISEWCNDGYDDRFYIISPITDPVGPANAPQACIRGGSWGWWAYSTASGIRGNLERLHAGDGDGFRVVKSIVLSSPVK